MPEPSATSRDAPAWLIGTPPAVLPHVDRYADVQAIIDGLDDERRHILLLRLAAKLNNGTEHFDHTQFGYSWLCHRCVQQGKGGLNGWVGALSMLAHANSPTGGAE